MSTDLLPPPAPTVLSPADRLRALVRRARELFADRARREAELTESSADRADRLTRAADNARRTAEAQYAAETDSLDRAVAEARRQTTARYEAARTAAEKEYGTARQRLREEAEAAAEAIRHEHQAAEWAATAKWEEARKRARSHRQKVLWSLGIRRRKLAEVRTQAESLLRAGRLLPAEAPPVPSFEDEVRQARDLAPLEAMRQRVTLANGRLRQLRDAVAPPFWVPLAVWGAVPVLAVAVLALLVWKKPDPAWLTAAALLSVVAEGGVVWWRARSVRRAVRRHYPALCAELALAEGWGGRARKEVDDDCRRRLRAGKRRLKRERRVAAATFGPRLEEVERRRTAGDEAAAERRRAAVGEATARRDSETARADAQERARRADIEARGRAARERAAAEAARAGTTLDAERRRAGEELAAWWSDGLAAVEAEAAELRALADRAGPDWDSPSWQQWSPPEQVPSALRFGTLTLDPAALPGGMPEDPALPRPEASWRLPALLDFPRRSALLLRAVEQGRPAAVRVLQGAMARFLTSLPPGKVRFTVIDPVGLGENFAAFMHLADYDEQLVASRIWTEPDHVEKRLGDLTAHMENVIQKYLRNQYASIEEYNRQAGEVAEPFRVLVVANFPAAFSPEAARRLVSIAGSGAACGVYTLVSVDTKQPLPQGFKLADLEAVSATMTWREGRFHWKDADYAELPLTPDGPPADDRLTALLHTVGAAARGAKRVEVPFDFIAPPPERRWRLDSRSGVDVPLGRAGATRRQHLQLGKGTAQHALVAGKTGSGKSTLLHALITNVALHYPPDEVELYLIDFKKGVEFKMYAEERLPHARVIAVESEREFGLSVLQRLDAELKRRGELFRARNVHDLPGYRDATARNNRSAELEDVLAELPVTGLVSAGPASAGRAALLPRIMLIVDEFQEFFVEDDKIAQEAALLLDRLVRQGRAFGIHVLLGSQTLGGAYSLARSTIDQMAVRIALQCSDADAALILSKDNAAARLLSRPGEAIYNDANGLLEGNDLFQVVWLSEERRSALLREVRKHFAGDGRPPALVFEGNAAAAPAGNQPLAEALAHPATAPRRELRAWLGEAVAIKDPTAAVFRAQSGANLLVVGQQSEPAVGMLACGVVGLAAQMPATVGELPTFTVLDAAPPDDPAAGVWERVREALPHAVGLAGWRDTPEALAPLAAEVERRQRERDLEAPPLFLVVVGLHRFRELRKPDDEFGFGRKGEDRPNPGKQFAALLRDGPAVGVHTLAWCDSWNNLTRMLDRQSLREFEQRVALQMSASDSSNLLDSPLAGRLGLHRGLYLGPELSQPEKFRPYDPPPAAWLAEAGRRLRGG